MILLFFFKSFHCCQLISEAGVELLAFEHELQVNRALSDGCDGERDLCNPLLKQVNRPGLLSSIHVFW